MQWRYWRNWGTAAALVVAFLISGIWHGASWGFVVWGGLHGFYMACSVFYRPYQKKLHKALGVENSQFLRAWQVFVTFNLVSFAWIFFRAGKLSDAIYIIVNLFNGMKGLRLISQGLNETVLVIVSLFIIAMRKYILSRYQQSGSQSFMSQQTLLLRWTIYISLPIFIILFAFCTNSNFIYNKC